MKYEVANVTMSNKYLKYVMRHFHQISFAKGVIKISKVSKAGQSEIINILLEIKLNDKMSN
jgi:hypothetical protein